MKRPLVDPLPRHGIVAVFGLGASGIAACWLLSNFRKTIIASDTADESQRARLVRSLPPDVSLVLGRNVIDSATVIIASPGMLPTTPIFDEARAKNIPIISELELAARATSRPIIAITGTDGKTTTTSLTAHILSQCNIPNALGGNIGIPFTQSVKEAENVDYFVIETSAFQLVFSPTFHPHILIATNIAEDHSEYFQGNWEQYVETKKKPILQMTNDDIAILNASDPEIKKWANDTKATIAWYANSLDDIPKNADMFAYITDESLEFCIGDFRYRLARDYITMRGHHNLMNIMGAFLSAMLLGCNPENICEALNTYALPKHRIETVCIRHDIEFIDDSKATNPHAAIAALETINQPTILIVGGVDKGLSLREWIDAMRQNVRHIMLIGALSDRFQNEALDAKLDIPIHRCDTLEDAVNTAYRIARNDCCHVIMLSPGCSSYDMFKSYNERGDRFAKAAQNLLN